MKLTAELVHSTFLECLFKDDENVNKYIVGEGIQLKIGFNPKRLKENDSLIGELLNELPNEFKKESCGGGGGMSFLNMCNDKDGNQWTGSQQIMEELALLGNATGKSIFLGPREMWQLFPGGVPYLVIN